MFKLLCFLLLMFITQISNAVNVNEYIPDKAYSFNSIILSEINRYFPNIPNIYYIPGLIEHESCVSLTNKLCWNSRSQLKTSRELGVGLGMITKAYNQNGSVRFDSLDDLRRLYKNELREAKWETIRERPDIQIRMILLMSYNNYSRLYDVDDGIEKLALIDAAYNGGLGGLQKERRQCGLTKGCNPNIWFDNVEKVCLKSKKPLYGNRSACDINRNHVKDVLKVRMIKYEKKDYYGINK